MRCRSPTACLPGRHVSRRSTALKMRTFRLTLAYDGTRFAGWQVQPGQSTVQGVLEQAVEQITGHATRVVASGRTDAGVHARRQVASFRSATRLTSDVLCRALNACTPDEVFVWSVDQMPDDFHALRSAISKRYRYAVQDGPIRDLFTRQCAWWVAETLDLQAMRHAARSLVGRHDFSSFEAAGSPRKTSVRQVSLLSIERGQASMSRPIWIDIQADGFLYNMVRNIVGTLVEVGRGRNSADWVENVLAARDRSRAGPTAPAHGLTLWEVHYPPPAPRATVRTELPDAPGSA